MKDKNKSSQKKSTAAKRIGAGGGMRRSSTTVPSDRSIQQATPTQVEAPFRAVFESSRNAIGVSKAGIHVFVNPAYLELFGFPRGTDLAGKPVLDLIAPESRDQIRANILLRERGEAVPSTYETRGLRTDASDFDMEVNASQYQEKGENHTVVILRNITRRKLAEEALRESEERFRDLVETSYDWIWAVDENGVYTYASPRVKDILGYAPDEVVGRTPFDFMTPKEKEHVAGEYGKVVAKRGPLEALENVNRHKDGREVILETSGMPIFDRVGGFKGYRGIDRDITARKHAETVLRISEERFRKVFLNSPDSININCLEDGMYISINQGFTATTGYTAADVISRTSLELNLWADPADRQKLVEGLRKQGEVKNLEARFRLKDGRIIDGLMSASIVEIDHIPHIVSVTRDITERKRSESALKQSEAKYRLLYNETPVLLHSIDRNGTLVEVSDYWLKTMGHERSEVIGRKVTDFFTEASRKYAQEIIQPAFFRNGSVKDVSYQFIKKNGEVLDVVLSATAERDPSGKAVRSLAVIEDVTERKRAEEKISAYSIGLQRLLSVSREMTATTDIARLYRTAIQTAVDLLLFDFSTVMVLSDDRSSLTIMDSIGFPTSMIGHFHLVEGQGLATYSVQTGMPEAVVDFHTESRFEVPSIVRDSHIRSALCVPMMLEDRVFGVLIGHTLAQREFSREDIAIYQNIGNQAAIAITNAMNRQALQKSERMLQTIIDTEPDCIKVLDEESRLIMMNRAGLNMIQADFLGQVKGQFVCPMVAPEYQQAFMDLTRQVFQGGSGTLEFRMVGMRGSQLWLETHAVPLRNEKDEIIALLGVTRDITGRKRAEVALRWSEARYRMLYQGTPVMMHSIDAEGNLVSVSDQWLKQLGYTRDEVLGRRSTEFLDEQSSIYARTVVLPDFMRTGLCTDVPYTYLKKNGESISALLSAIAERDEAGNVVRSLAVIIDITERKRAEEALRENQARLDLALQSAHMGVWRWEIKENKRYFDDLTCQVLGIDATTFTGTAEEFYRAVHPEDRDKLKAAIARTIEQDVTYEPSYRVVWPDGSVHFITSRGRLVRDDKGKPARVNGILWDITDQRLVEQELIKTQKLESIGTLAGGIAHDFNNLLQGIFGYISMAKLTFDQKEKALAMLAQAEKALQQSVNLTSQLLTFSKGGMPMKKVIALRPVIENSVAFALSGSHNTAEIVIDEGLRAVEADEGQIGQVIQNILLNADQSMPLGGRIRVSVRNMQAAAVTPHVELQGDLVEISIRDQGTGIPAEHLTRIFDPYFTTKEKGSGLGLATSYSIIKNHGGLVRVQSEVGKGTTFFIYLPASGSEAEDPKSPAIPAMTRKGRILVMDDEEIVRAVAGELLTALGHEVAFAEKGETALESYRAARNAGRPFDLVILDLTIRGGMGGTETLRTLREIDPDVKAVVSSGYSDDAALSNYLEQGFRAFLKKPYNMEELQSTLNALLA